MEASVSILQMTCCTWGACAVLISLLAQCVTENNTAVCVGTLRVRPQQLWYPKSFLNWRFSCGGHLAAQVTRMWTSAIMKACESVAVWCAYRFGESGLLYSAGNELYVTSFNLLWIQLWIWLSTNYLSIIHVLHSKCWHTCLSYSCLTF